MDTILYRIPNLSCGHCVHTIQTELAGLQGVLQVRIEQSSKEVEIRYETPATENEIENLLREINYPPELIPSQSVQ